MSSTSNKVVCSVGAVVGVTVLSSASYWFFKKFLKKDPIPSKWRRIGTLEQINVFPVKSCASLKLQRETEFECEVLGLRIGELKDRSFMLMDEDHIMVTARVYPKMILIKTQLVNFSRLIVSSPNMEKSMEIDLLGLDDIPCRGVRTSVWGSDLDVMLCGTEYDKWFSECILNQPTGVRLVYYMHNLPVRKTNARLVKEPYIKQEDSGTFNDATSYMLMNLASIDDLNTRIPRPVDPMQFRGNFHLKMDRPQPYAEDKWGWIRIGDEAVFRVVAPCTRCIFPNINVVTAERDPDGEPLKTLRTYRLWDKYASPALGLHLGLRQSGKVKCNDVVYIEEK